jgi:pyruvate-formate lyase
MSQIDYREFENYREAKIFLDQKQDEHFDKYGVNADTNDKIAQWMEEYHQEKIKKNIKKV